MSDLIGAPAPDFTLVDQTRTQVSLESLRGSKTLLVFIPFPFTGVCNSEACELRDNLSALSELDAKVVIVTAHAVPTLAEWAKQNDFTFPVLSDYWPHGAVATAYGTFDEKLGAATRSTFVLDADGIVRRVIASDHIPVAREFDAYAEALAAI